MKLTAKVVVKLGMEWHIWRNEELGTEVVQDGRTCRVRVITRAVESISHFPTTSQCASLVSRWVGSFGNTTYRGEKCVTLRNHPLLKEARWPQLSGTQSEIRSIKRHRNHIAHSLIFIRFVRITSILACIFTSDSSNMPMHYAIESLLDKALHPPASILSCQELKTELKSGKKWNGIARKAFISNFLRALLSVAAA